MKRKKSQSGFVPPLNIIFNRIFPFHMEDLKNLIPNCQKILTRTIPVLSKRNRKYCFDLPRIGIENHHAVGEIDRQRKTCFRQLNQFRCTVDFSGVQCICQIRPGAEIVNSIRYCFLLSRVQMKNRRTPAFLPGCSPVLPFHRIKSLSVFMPLSALFPHCCTPSRKTAPAN